MIELRWLVRSGWDGPEKVLQYRQQYDATIRAGMPNMINWPHEPAPKMVWSEWKDVPKVDGAEE